MEAIHLIDSKAAISAEIRYRWKSVMAYCMDRRLNPNHVENMLKDRTHHSTHPEIKNVINADLGITDKSWEK